MEGAYFDMNGGAGWENVGEPWWGDKTILNESTISLSLRATGETDEAGR